jgi:hypothetical protein
MLQQTLLLLVAVASCTCCHPKPPRHEQAIYEGPTQTLSEVVADINQNNRRVNTLWSRGNFKAWLRDDKGNRHFVEGDANLQYRKPQELSLRGSDPLAGQIFQVGSNDQRYWLLVKPELDTLWYGSYDAPNADLSKIPIRPDLLLEVLGVNDINPDFRAQPMPVMKFNNDRDVYMITWHVMRPDRLVAQKEIWYDRRTKLPRLVVLYDENGRAVLRAYLSDHQRVPVEGQPQDQSPVVATAYDLYFPESKAQIVLTLRDLQSKYHGAGGRTFPNDASFRFPGTDAAAKTIAVDDEQPQR